VPEIQVADHVDIETLRKRLRKMTDAELLRFGKDNRYMRSPYANMGKPPLQAFVIQLREDGEGGTLRLRAQCRSRFVDLALRAP